MEPHSETERYVRFLTIHISSMVQWSRKWRAVLNGLVGLWALHSNFVAMSSLLSFAFCDYSLWAVSRRPSGDLAIDLMVCYTLVHTHTTETETCSVNASCWSVCCFPIHMHKDTLDPPARWMECWCRIILEYGERERERERQQTWEAREEGF